MPQVKGAHVGSPDDLLAMYESGMLTQAEYEAFKQKLFGRAGAGAQSRAMVPGAGAPQPGAAPAMPMR